MHAPPLVIVGLPTYNRPDGLRMALSSITNQSYAHLEILVSDNGSSDTRVRTVLDEFCAHDDRIAVTFHEENRGAVFNFLFVLHQAAGDYFMWASDDDWWDADFVEKTVAALDEHPSAVACWSDVSFHTDRDEVKARLADSYALYTNPDIGALNKVEALLRYHGQHGWYGMYALFRRETLLLASGEHLVEESLVWGFDIGLVSEVILAGPILKIHEPLFHYSLRGCGFDGIPHRSRCPRSPRPPDRTRIWTCCL